MCEKERERPINCYSSISNISVALIPSYLSLELFHRCIWTFICRWDQFTQCHLVVIGQHKEMMVQGTWTRIKRENLLEMTLYLQWIQTLNNLTLITNCKLNNLHPRCQLHKEELSLDSRHKADIPLVHTLYPSVTFWFQVRAVLSQHAVRNVKKPRDAQRCREQSKTNRLAGVQPLAPRPGRSAGQRNQCNTCKRQIKTTKQEKSVKPDQKDKYKHCCQIKVNLKGYKDF